MEDRLDENRRRPTAFEQLIGGSPLGVIVRLGIMSFVVGLAMRALDLHPNDLIVWVEARLRDIAGLSFESIEGLINVLVLGAIVVVPIWIILRIMKIVSK